MRLSSRTLLLKVFLNRIELQEVLFIQLNSKRSRVSKKKTKTPVVYMHEAEISHFM